MSEFKGGDHVYYPHEFGGEVVILQSKITQSSDYPVGVLIPQKNTFSVFTRDGRCLKNQKVPVLFHVTPENKVALETLYPQFEFDDIPAKSNAIIMLSNGGGQLVCWVSDGTVIPDSRDKIAVIKKFDGEFFHDVQDLRWRYVTPIPKGYFNTSDFSYAEDVV